MGRSIVIGVAIGCIASAVSAAQIEDKPAEPAAVVQGRWVRQQNTPDGAVTLVKEHQGNSTTLTATDAAGKILYAHTSQFTVEDLGKVSILTFSNRVITAGPQKGGTQKESTSYIFRVHNDRFLEVRGVLEDDPSPPGIIVWERQDQPRQE
jgi:hypothetical protein